VNWRRDYFQVDSARLWGVPDVPVPIGVAMSGTNGVEKFAKLADHLIAVQPDADLVGAWHAARQAPTPAGFAGATQFVRTEDVAESIPCGPDLDAIVDAVRPYWEAGFTDVALVQIGGETQDRFLKEAAEPLLKALRAASN
jgi:hypothetical protein